jgi:hypothetical protein
MLFLDYRGRNIRLTEERWKHINERHPETMKKEKFLKKQRPQVRIHTKKEYPPLHPSQEGNRRIPYEPE